jgi:hypothetical protein
MIGSAPFDGFANGVAIRGDFAYVSDETFGVRKFDVSRPASPKAAGGFKTPGEPYGVRVEGDLVIVPDSFSLFVLK